MRNDVPEQTMMIHQLIDPPQGEDFIPLAGDLFPTEYPIKDPYTMFNFGSYFFRKYYIT
jgi:hypothetical protein